MQSQGHAADLASPTLGINAEETHQVTGSTIVPGESIEHNHPNALRYVQIALVLAALTAFEVTVYYVKPLKEPLVPILLALSAIKFFLVVSFYMHLKFDNRIFSALFCLGLFLAGSIMIALIVMFRAYIFAGGL